MRKHSLLQSLLPPLALAAFMALSTGCTRLEPLDPVPPPALPENDVELVRDDLGITHIYARSDRDAFFAQGYMAAKDRLFQMELNRRRARGTLAEVLGDKQIGDDISSRTIGFARLGQQDAERIKEERPEDYTLADAWVQGVNRRIEEIEEGEAPRPYGLRETELDILPEKWTPNDIFAIGKTLSFGLSNTLDYDVLSTAILRIRPDTAADIPLSLPAFDTTILSPGAKPAPPAPPGPSIKELGAPRSPSPERFDFKRISPQLASNNWAIDGAHTDSGRPLLAGDPHQSLTSPSRLWPTHINSADAGGSFDVIGFAFAGTPGVQLGHNAHVGWTATTNFADVMDLWDVKPNGDWESVTLGEEERAITTRTETIKVKGAEDTVIDVHEVPGFGVFLPEGILPVPKLFLADGELLFNWTGFSPTREASAYVGIDRATNIDELEQAADLLDVGAVNFIAADKDEITYHVHALIPDRGDPASRPMPWHAVTAEDPENFWTRGYLPDALLPHVRAPEEGFVLSANNDPFGFTLDGSVENDPYYYGGVYASGFRAHRIHELIEQKLAAGKMTAAGMQEIQRDARQPMVDTLVPPLTAAMAAVGVDPALDAYKERDDLASLAARLEAWDGRFVRDSSEAVIFFAFQWFTAKRVFEGPFSTPLFNGIASASPPYFIGQLRNVMEKRFPAADKLLPEGPGPVLLGALDDTAQWLVKRFGGIDSAYKWSDVHAVEVRGIHGEALDMPAMARDGGIDTVNVSDCKFFDDDGAARDKFISHDGSIYRFVMGFGEDGRPRATVNFSQGASGEPDDPHFSDQNARWVEGEQTQLLFERADVDAHTEEKVTLKAK